MPRIRTVKPEFFKHFDLFSLEKEHKLPMRLAFEGLWLCADKEGRFRWLPMQLKLDILPYDEVDFEKIMNILSESDFIRKYEHEKREYGYIPTFTEHQRITGTEASAESKLPPPKQLGKKKETPKKQYGNTKETYRTTGREGKGKGKGKEGNGEGFFPTQEFEIFLTENEIGKAVEYITITKNVSANEKLIQTLFSTFKIKNFTGEKFYRNDRDIITHFFESLKFVQLNGSTTHQPTTTESVKQGTSAARIDALKKW